MLSVFYIVDEAKDAKPDEFIDTLLASNEETSIAKFDLGTFLNSYDVNDYYRYKGTLTTTPCEGAVEWVLVTTPRKMNAA